MATAPHFDQEATMPETVTLDRPSTGRIFLKQRLVWAGGVMVLFLGLAALAAPALTRMGRLRIPVGPGHDAGKNGALRGFSVAKPTGFGESTFFQNLSRFILQTRLGKRIEGADAPGGGMS
jgi:hypothetical protein